MDSCIRDVRLALRGLRRSPGFALTAILMLAVGIGAVTIIFALDRLASLRGVKFRIVGVMPAGFTGIDPGVPNEVMLPFAARQLTNPAPFDPDRWGSCSLVARLDPAVPAERVRLAAEAVVHQFIEAHPPKESYELPRLWMTVVSRGMDSLRTATSRPLLILFSMVIATLLIACANVAGLIEEARGHAIGIDQLLA